MSKKVTVVVQCAHVLQDIDGNLMNQWEYHVVELNEHIEQYISDGHLIVLDSEEEVEETPAEDEVKKTTPVTNKSNKQATASVQQENV